MVRLEGVNGRRDGGTDGRRRVIDVAVHVNGSIAAHIACGCLAGARKGAVPGYTTYYCVSSCRTHLFKRCRTINRKLETRVQGRPDHEVPFVSLFFVGVCEPWAGWRVRGSPLGSLQVLGDFFFLSGLYRLAVKMLH